MDGWLHRARALPRWAVGPTRAVGQVAGLVGGVAVVMLVVSGARESRVKEQSLAAAAARAEAGVASEVMMWRASHCRLTLVEPTRKCYACRDEGFLERAVHATGALGAAMARIDRQFGSTDAIQAGVTYCE